jgi:cold shock CspA family protein/uncharacterized LabA/DUF88 family protein
MIKVMVFIDGSWLYRARQILRNKISPALTIDYGKLPKILCAKLGEQLGIEVDLVRTYFFASIPTNYDPRDRGDVEEQQNFHDILKEDFHYEVEIFPIDFRGRRIRKRDRDPKDEFEPKEKRVDVALASTMLYFAAIPYAYDAAIAVIGDEDYIPVLQHVRRLGKRVMIASIHGSCSDFYDPEKDPTDDHRVRVIDTVFLDEIIGEVLLEPQLTQVECQSPLHQGDRIVWTKERIRKGKPFYCERCRQLYAEQRKQAEIALEEEFPESLLTGLLEGYRPGRISKLVRDKGYGFIRSIDNKSYFFHATNLVDIDFKKLTEFQYVQFQVKTEPGPENNYKGDVHQVRLLEAAKTSVPESGTKTPSE